MNQKRNVMPRENIVKTPIERKVKPIVKTNEIQVLIDNIQNELDSKLIVTYKAYKEDGSHIEKGDEFYLDIKISVDDTHYKNLAFEEVRVMLIANNFATILNPTHTRLFRSIQKVFTNVSGTNSKMVQAKLLAAEAIYPENIDDIVENIGVFTIQAIPNIQSLFHINRLISDIEVDIEPDH